MPLSWDPAQPRSWLLALLIWLALILLHRLTLYRAFRRGPRGDAVTGFAWYIARIVGRLVHHVTFENAGIVPDTNDPGGLIVVSNHTGPVDPVLIQAGCRFHIRWMMASDMMTPGADWVWRLADVIPVERSGRDLTPTREAIRHVKAGKVLGIFPEGRIVTPPREIRPFASGVGLIIARAKAPVLLCWVSGTPETLDTVRGIITPSRARVRFVERIDFGGETDAEAITRTLRQRLAEVSGWPLNDDPLPPRPAERRPDPFLV